VDRWELVAEKDATNLYRLELTATALPEDTTDDHGALLGSCDTTMTDRGVLLSLVGSQDAIRDMLRNFEAAGTTPDLRRLAEYEGESDRPDEDELAAAYREASESADHLAEEWKGASDEAWNGLDE
jgi:hypothetical protein